MTETPTSITFFSVVSRDSVRILLTITVLNGLDVLACNIQNAYLIVHCREKIWTRAGWEFGSESGQIMLIVRALYGLKSSGASFRSYLADHLWDIGYRPSQADGDVWMRAAVKLNGFKYWEYILCYVNDLLSISHQPKNSLEAIRKHFKFKHYKMEIPESYLGGQLSRLANKEGHNCWTMLSDKYCAALVRTVEIVLEKKGLRLAPKCYTPFQTSYRPEMDITAKLKKNGVQWYQELIGSLRWACELGRVNILYETTLLSQRLALPCKGHLEQLFHVIGYLKAHPKFKIMFDSGYPRVNNKWFTTYDWEGFYCGAKEAIPPNMPEPRGLMVSTSAFVDADLAGDKIDRRSMTGLLLFINKAPIHYYSKK